MRRTWGTYSILLIFITLILGAVLIYDGVQHGFTTFRVLELVILVFLFLLELFD